MPDKAAGVGKGRSTPSTAIILDFGMRMNMFPKVEGVGVGFSTNSTFQQFLSYTVSCKMFLKVFVTPKTRTTYLADRVNLVLFNCWCYLYCLTEKQQTMR